MDVKMEIKQEPCFPHLCAENETEICSEDELLEVKNEAVTHSSDYIRDTKTEIKDESIISAFSQIERDLLHKEVVKKLKHKMITNVNDCEIDTNTVIEEGTVDSNFCSQNVGELFSKDGVIELNKCNGHYEMNSKVEFKEEQWWMESSSRDIPWISDEIKNGMTDDCSLSQSPRLLKGFSGDKSALIPNETLENEISLKMKDSTEYKSPQNNKSRESVYLEQPDIRKMISTTTCLKENHLFLENNTHKENSCKNYTNRSNLITDNMITEYKCDICELKFPSPLYLKLHKFIHEDKMPHKSDTSRNGCTQMSHLKKSKLLQEGTQTHKCEICGKSFTWLSDLREHKWIHKSTKSHKCEICGKSFTQLSNLETHKLIHEGTKLHRCETCGKGLTRLSSLKRHFLIHEGRKPHKCEICGKTCTRLSNLREHKLFHEGQKPHNCEVCGKSFTRLSDLKRHKLIHEVRNPQY